MKYFIIFIVFFFSCQGADFVEQKTESKSDNLDLIVEYLKQREQIKNKGDSSVENQILRHLLFGDSLSSNLLKSKIELKEFYRKQDKLIADSLMLQPLEDLNSEQSLRVISSTSIYPMLTVITIGRKANYFFFEQKSCLFSYSYLDDEIIGNSYKLEVNNETIEGKFFYTHDRKKFITEREYYDFLNICRPFDDMQDILVSTTKMLDGESLTVERCIQYEPDYLSKSVKHFHVSNFWEEINSFSERIFKGTMK